MVTDEAIRALRTDELPVLDRRAYLDYATVGPIPCSHARAAAELLDRLAMEGPTPGEGMRLLEDVRGEAARLLRSTPDRVALLKSTSEGLGLVAQGLDWREGDEVVLYEREFSGCLAPFLHLRDRGVRVRWLPDRGDRFELDDVAAALTPRTRAVCVSLVNRSHGFRAPCEELAALCREHRAWLVLDAAQAMGGLDLDADAIGADVVAAHGYKLLCSGFGLAVVHCSARAIGELRVPQPGWKNTTLDDGFAVIPEGEARRFESTMSSLAGLAGMRASLALLNGIDPAERERRAVALAVAVADRLAERGYELPVRADGERSTLAVARRPGVDPERLADELEGRGVVCAAVDGALRFSTHVFTTEADVEALLDALPDAERSAGR